MSKTPPFNYIFYSGQLCDSGRWSSRSPVWGLGVWFLAPAVTCSSVFGHVAEPRSAPGGFFHRCMRLYEWLLDLMSVEWQPSTSVGTWRMLTRIIKQFEWWLRREALKISAGVRRMSSGVSQLEERSCSVVWWYGSGYFRISCQMAAGWTDGAGVLPSYDLTSTTTLMLCWWVPMLFSVVLINHCRSFLSWIRRITVPGDSLPLKPIKKTGHYMFKIIIHVVLEHTWSVSLQKIQLPSFVLRLSWKTVS